MYLGKELSINMQNYLTFAKKGELFDGQPIFYRGQYSKFMTISLLGILSAYKIKISTML